MRTSLEVENVRPIRLLDPHGLILVRVIQCSFFVPVYREVERSDATLERCIERGPVSALRRLRDDLAAAEAILRRTASGNENGRLVYVDADRLLWFGPYRRRVPGGPLVAQNAKILRGQVGQTCCRGS